MRALPAKGDHQAFGSFCSYGSAIYGLVPDGVAQVAATFAATTGSAPQVGDDGRISASVVDNFFTIGVAAVQVGGNGATPARPEQLRGLDADGKLVVMVRP